MVTKKKAKKKTTAITNWDEELARQAMAAAKQEANTGGGSFFSLKNSQLSLNDAPIPDNEIVVVIIESIMENTYYEEAFDSDNPAQPSCYAFGHDEEEMAPHEEVGNPEHESCAGCPQNEWGSSDRGRGKACRNRRRLALIPAGPDGALITDPEHYVKAEVAYLAVPPTSLKSFGSYVKSTAGVLKRPPHAVFTRIAVVPDPKTQLKVTFEALDPVPNELIGTLMERHAELEATIDFPYPKNEEQPKPKRNRGGKKKKKAARRSGREKY